MRIFVQIFIASIFVHASAFASTCASVLQPVQSYARGIVSSCQTLDTMMEQAPTKIRASVNRAALSHAARTAQMGGSTDSQMDAGEDAGSGYQIAGEENARANAEISTFTARFNVEIIKLRDRKSVLERANPRSQQAIQQLQAAEQFLAEKLHRARSIRYDLVAELERNNISSFSLAQALGRSGKMQESLFSVNGDWSNDGQAPSGISGGNAGGNPGANQGGISGRSPPIKDFNGNQGNYGGQEGGMGDSPQPAPNKAAHNPNPVKAPDEPQQQALNPSLEGSGSNHAPQAAQSPATPAVTTLNQAPSPISAIEQPRQMAARPPVQEPNFQSEIPTGIPPAQFSPAVNAGAVEADSPAIAMAQLEPPRPSDTHNGNGLNYLLGDPEDQNIDIAKIDEGTNTSGASKMAEQLAGRLEAESVGRQVSDALGTTDERASEKESAKANNDAATETKPNPENIATDLASEKAIPASEADIAAPAAVEQAKPASSESIAANATNNSELGIPTAFQIDALLSTEAPPQPLPVAAQIEYLLSPEEIEASTQLSDSLLSTVIADGEFPAQAMSEIAFAKPNK